jgi:hypothetical protein
LNRSSNIIVLSIVASVAIITMLMIIPFNLNNSNSLGQAVHPLYPAFSAPESGFTINGNSLSATDDAVYKIGYYSINGGAWQSFTLTGTVLGGSWLTGTATYNLPNFGTGEHYVVVYSCKRISSSWDCYGNRWQLQIITNTATCTGSTTQTCIITNGQGTQSMTCNSGTWSSWSICTVSSCDTGYTKSGNTCVSVSTGIGPTYYVATDGNDNNPGTINQPWATWQKGFRSLVAGDTLYIRGGTYTGMADGNHGVVIYGVHGTSDNHITVSAYPGEKPVLDGSSLTSTTESNIGMLLEYCSYWNIKGLTVTNFLQYSDNSHNSPGLVLVANNDMLIEQFTVHDCGDGFLIWEGGDNIYYKNCDAYQNHDRYIGLGDEKPGGLANGFFPPIYSGQHVTFDGCRSWANSDDGWDLFSGKGTIDFINCWAFENGNGYGGVTGDGDGFKLGPTNDSTARRVLKNCIAANNGGYTQGNGFDQNTGPGWVYIPITIYNSASYNNKGVGYQFYWESGSTIRNSISYGELPGSFGSSIITDHNSWDTSGITVESADFVSLDSSQLSKPRKADGSLPDITFLHLATGSDLINKGVNVGLSYSGSAPDLGAFETG